MTNPPSLGLVPVLELAAQREATCRRLLREALNSWTLSADDRAWLTAVLGLSRPGDRFTADASLLSDTTLRAFATQRLIDLMTAHWRARPPGRRYYSVTIFDDSGVSYDRAPRFNLPALVKKFRAALARTPLTLVMQLEIQGVMNYPRGALGRALLGHAHGIGWTDDPAWMAQPEKYADKFAATLNASRHWASELGGKPLVINLVRDTEFDVATVCAYLTKPLHDVKNRMDDDNNPGGFIMMDTDELRPDLALRIAEGLSQIDWRDAVFTIGKDPVCRDWRRDVLAWHRRRLASRGVIDVGERGDVAAQWAALRQANGSRHFGQPYEW